MNTQEKVIARLMLKNKVLEADGQQFEDLFVSIMGYARSDFQPIRPQGKIGDRKNDGCEPTVGRYYQVYAPQNASTKESASVKKLETDFAGLKAYWGSMHSIGIQEFFFVLNDRYKGAFPTTHKGNGAGNAAAALAADKASEQEKPAPATPLATMATAASAAEEGQAKPERRRSRGGRKPAAKKTDAHAASPRRASAEQTQAEPAALAAIPAASQADHPQPASLASAPVEQVAIISEGKAEKKPARKTSGTGRAKTSGSGTPPTEAAPAKAERKPATRARRPRKAEAADE